MKPNMGTIDRLLRTVVAVVIIALWYYGYIGQGWAIFLLAVASIFILTSLFSVCPIYSIFGLSTKKPSVDFRQLLADGATVVDVRTKREFSSGHLEESINIPLDQLSVNLFQLPDKMHSVVVCCASGVRSAAARNLLKDNGYTKVYNGGSWIDLKNKR